MQKTLSTLKSLIIVLALTIGLSYVFAWTAPNSTPPNCTAGDPGCDAPINVGGILQNKAGALTLGTSGVTPVTNPMLDVFGNISGQGLLLSGKGYSTNDFCIVDPTTKAEIRCLSDEVSQNQRTLYYCTCRNGSTTTYSLTNKSTETNPIDGIVGSCASSGPKTESASYYQWTCTEV